MFELEVVCKNGNDIIKKAILTKEYTLCKIKDFLTTEVCKKSVEYVNKRDKYDLYIRRDGAYVEFTEKDTFKTYIYRILENGKYIEYKPSGLI